jgi:hypothetical protein
MLQKAIFYLAAVSLSTLSPAIACAFDATLIIEAQEVSTSEPWFSSEDLRGRLVWLGDDTGERGQALVGDGSRLAYDKGKGPFLAYGEPAEFIRLERTPIDDAQIKKSVLAALQELATDAQKSIDIQTLARVDLNFDGKDEIIVQAHTTRDVDDPYAGTPEDVEALLVLSDDNGKFKVADSIAAFADQDQDGGARSIVELLAMGRRPNGHWDLLVRQTAQYVGKSPITINFEINGEQTKQPDPSETRVTKYSIAVYHYAEGKLLPSDQLAIAGTSFCVIKHCKD